jgi:uncharacterized membrane protein YoaK (UPF0700 family)
MGFTTFSSVTGVFVYFVSTLLRMLGIDILASQTLEE